MASVGLLHQIFGQAFLGTKSAHEASEEDRRTRRRHPRGEASQDGVQRRTVGEIEEGIRGEPIPDGATEAAALEGFGSERGADQDLVPEQAGENQEGQRPEKSAGASADGAGALQSLDGAAY